MLDQCSSHWSVSPDTCLTEVPPGEYSLMSRRLIFLLILLSSLLFLLLLSIIQAPIPIKYFFHPDCPCHRLDPPAPPPAPPPPTSGRWTPPLGSFVGPSTCNSYTTVLGAGQRVLSYTYYTPWQVFLAKISHSFETGAPLLKTAKARYSPGGAPLNSVARFQVEIDPKSKFL